jgi:ribonuclease VapC
VSSWVLDASAVLALVKSEPGGERVRNAVKAGAAISAVNLSEVVAKLVHEGAGEAAIRALVDSLRLRVVHFDAELAYRAGLLRSLTKQLGLSLGDRACLALAHHLGLPALTADRAWQGLQLGVTIQVIR